MRAISENARIAALMFIGGLGTAVQAFSRDSMETPPKIVIQVMDYARIDPTVMERTCGVVTRILREAGIDADCRIRTENYEAGLSPSTSSGCCEFYVVIASERMATMLGRSRTELGIVPGDAFSDQRKIAYIFDDTANLLAWEKPGTEKDLILGCAIAHEIGHLLLLRDHHSLMGIMRARWNENDLLDMARNAFQFLPVEARQMQAEIARRKSVKAAATSTASLTQGSLQAR